MTTQFFYGQYFSIFSCLILFFLHPFSLLESFRMTFPRVSPSGGGPEKLACPPNDPPPHCFDPKMLILSFSCSLWPFCPNLTPTSRPQLGNPVSFTPFPFRQWHDSMFCVNFDVYSTSTPWILYSRALSLTDSGMPEFSRHSLHEYCSLAQHFRSVTTKRSTNFTILVRVILH